MSSLFTLAKRAVDTKGIMHKASINTLRTYINTTPEPDLIKAINNVWRADILRAMWEAGLNQTLQDAVTKRLEELK